MKMALSKESILSLDPAEFSATDKRALLDRFFPAVPLPDWKRKLRKEWNDGVRWAAYAGTKPLGEDGVPYRYTHEYLNDRASYFPPKEKGNRVTDFTGWIYSLYQGRSDPQALNDGKIVERQVAAKLGPVPANRDWELIYADPLDGLPTAVKISALQVKGKPLWGAPDLVFRRKNDGAILIVERKASNRDIPADGWPNLRAQLWAYAQIDDWVDAVPITLIGEIWGFDGNRVFLRKVLRWNSGDPMFCASNAELFEKYRGA